MPAELSRFASHAFISAIVVVWDAPPDADEVTWYSVHATPVLGSDGYTGSHGFSRSAGGLVMDGAEREALIRYLEDGRQYRVAVCAFPDHRTTCSRRR